MVKNRDDIHSIVPLLNYSNISTIISDTFIILQLFKYCRVSKEYLWFYNVSLKLKTISRAFINHRKSGIIYFKQWNAKWFTIWQERKQFKLRFNHRNSGMFILSREKQGGSQYKNHVKKVWAEILEYSYETFDNKTVNNLFIIRTEN